MAAVARGGVRGEAGGACACMCVFERVCVCACSSPHRAPPHFTDIPGTVRRPLRCPAERDYLQHNATQLIKPSDKVVFVALHFFFVFMEGNLACLCKISTSASFVLICFFPDFGRKDFQHESIMNAARIT